MILIILLTLIIVKTIFLLFTKKVENCKGLYFLLLIFGIYILIISKFNNNFIIIRYILIYLLIDFLRFIVNKNIKIQKLLENKKNSKYCFIALLITSLSIWFISFEKIYIEFEGVEEIFNYSFPNYEILKIYEGKKDSIVIYDDGMLSTYFEKKENGRYQFSAFNNSTNYKSIPYKSTKVNDKLTIGVRTTKNSTKLISVYSSTNLKGVEFNDSLNSEFYKLNNIAYTVVDYDVKYYYIVINDEKFEFNFN